MAFIYRSTEYKYLLNRLSSHVIHHVHAEFDRRAVRVAPPRKFPISNFNRCQRSFTRDEFRFEPTAAQRSFPRPWERIPQKAMAPELRGRKIWKRYNLRGRQPVSSNDESNGKKMLHSSKRRRLRDPLEGLGKQSPSKPVPYAPSCYETQNVALPSKLRVVALYRSTAVS